LFCHCGKKKRDKQLPFSAVKDSHPSATVIPPEGVLFLEKESSTSFYFFVRIVGKSLK
jgi:hypothetical protein